MNSTLSYPEPSSSGDALAYLVEAATALAQMTNMASRPIASSGPMADTDYMSVVSNDEEEHHKAKTPAAASSSSSSSLLGSPNNNNSSSKRATFPQRLRAILSDESLSDVIAWLPHGLSFVIIRPDVFTDTVLPKYLPPTDARSSTKYASFTRKLNRWGFRQATRGPDTGAFTHPLFQKDKPELSGDMVCQRSRDRTSSPKENKKQGGSGEQSCASSPPVINHSAGNGSGVQSSSASLVVPAAPAASSKSVQALKEDGSVPLLPTLYKIPKGITTNQALIDSVLRQRDELERLQIAKAMLFDSYMKVLQQQENEDDS